MKAGDIDIYYEEHGSGPPLLLIAGYGQHVRVWEPVVEELAKSFRVITFDNRGMGRTSVTPPSYSMKQLAGDAVALLDGLGIAKAHIVGHSMGGCILQQLCIDYPKRVISAVIYSSLAVVPQAGALAMAITMEMAGVNPTIGNKMAILWAFGSTFLAKEGSFDRQLEHLLNNPYPPQADGILGQATAIKAFDSRENLSAIAPKTLVIAGEEDISTPIYCAKIMAEGIPNAKLHIVKGIGHSYHIEDPNRFIYTIKSFVS
jgi:3-oxoadipate enol-lactonase